VNANYYTICLLYPARIPSKFMPCKRLTDIKARILRI